MSEKLFFICPGWAGQADILTVSIHLEQSLAGHEPRSVFLACRFSLNSQGLSQAQDWDKLVSPPALGSCAMEPGRGEEPLPCLDQSVPVTMGAQRMWELDALCSKKGSEGVPSTCQLAADEPSTANGLPRLLLCFGSELPTQRWKAPSLTGLLIVQTTSLVLKWN